MRGLLLITCVLAVMGLAYWAYQENYRTQARAAEAAELSREIAALHERLALLEAEWAYLNRPARLRELAALNFPRLGLMPFAAEQFGTIDEVAFPRLPRMEVPDWPLMQLSGVVETRGTTTTVATGGEAGR